MHIILIGNLTNGFHAIGPYPDYKSAYNDATMFCHPGQFAIFVLGDPRTMDPMRPLAGDDDEA